MYIWKSLYTGVCCGIRYRQSVRVKTHTGTVGLARFRVEVYEGRREENAMFTEAVGSSHLQTDVSAELLGLRQGQLITAKADELITASPISDITAPENVKAKSFSEIRWTSLF